MPNLTPVQQYYKDKTVFITGASGFMGKVLLEKLLYSCSDLKEIIIIVRPKRGKTPDSRLEDMFKLPIFQRIKEEKPGVLKKVTIYQGDVTYDTLGLSGDNLKHVLANTNIVFHMAATLKLEGNLKDAVDMNLTGTKRALAIAKQMKNLEAFVHLSTAFCNCDQEVMYEKVYEFPHKPEDLMRLAEWMDVKTLDAITPDLLKPHPNTYTYSKRLAELLVRDHYDSMPVIIARPSIVSPSAYEPVRGWVDNLNGPTGLMVGAGKGVIRSMLIDEHHKSEVIPVDYAINGLVVIPYNFSQEASRPAEVPVYNITCADNRKVPWGEVIRLSKKIGYQYPVEAGLWYPDGCITTNRLHHKINVLLFHWLPAYFIDFMLFLLGQKRFMIRVQNRVQIGLEVLQFFTMRAWEFKATRYLNLWPNLTPEDQLIFNMKMETDETIEEYMLSCIQGGRQYLLKESPDSLPRARRQLVLPVDIPVYNITNADHRKKPLGEVVRVSKALSQEYPLNMGLWYPDPCVTTNKLYHKFNVIMFHWLPAYFIDFLLMIFGQKRFMVRVQQKISTGLDVLQFFTLNAWCFKSPAYAKLWADLTSEDKKIFNMDMDPPNTEEEYFINCVKGGRQFILKEKNEDIPKARMHLKIMWAVDRICKTIIVGGFFYYLLKWTGVLAMF